MSSTNNTTSRNAPTTSAAAVTRTNFALPTSAVTTPIPPALQAKLSAMAARNGAGSAPLSLRHMQPRRGAPPRLSTIPMSAGPAASGLGLGRPMANLSETPFARLSNIVDPSGVLRFRNAVIDSNGVRFPDGQSFSINIHQLELQDDLGKGNFGTVKRVLHRPTNVPMAMKEIRLELDDAKLNAIIMELDVLHRASLAPEIVEFYGAFFVEGCVYYCMECMDAGSMDALQHAGPGVPEPVLARILLSMVRGLKFLKDELQIMHRDVKPTNVLVNRKGTVKLCDFGVSGQLERSLARTHVGAQSYMAPERIDAGSTSGGTTGAGSSGSYTVAADVWSLGLTALEMAYGKFPYPFDIRAGALAQLMAIVNGAPPELPPEGFSDTARDWVRRCLNKVPDQRATYAELLDHPFLNNDSLREVDMASWVTNALDKLTSDMDVDSKV